MIQVTVTEERAVISSVWDKYTPSVRMAWAQEEKFARGYMIFDMSGEILFAKDNDNVFELLTRASLNYLDNRDVPESFCTKAEYIEALCAIGFKRDENKAHIAIKEFFKPCCGGAK